MTRQQVLDLYFMENRAKLIDIGAFIDRMERAIQMSELLRCSLESADDELEPCLQILLQIADSSITYGTRYPTELQAELVLELLIADESNPRSVAFQLATLLHQINRLQENEPGAESSTEREVVLKALNLVRSSRMADMSCRDIDGNFRALEELAGNLKATLWEISDALTARYFSNLTACRFTASS